MAVLRPVTVLAAALVGAAFVPPAGAAPPRGAIEETPVASVSADAKHVSETFVRVYDPLPEGSAKHPEACDYVTYLRFRHRKGPERASDADAVGVFMPGYLGGAAYFDQVARNTVLRAAERGRFVEFWALDRRSNCLEDHHGVHAAARAKDASLAFDYYWNGKEVEGRRFGGFESGEDVEVVREFGIERAVRDWHTVLTTGIPDRRDREQKVVCGGHSLGGRITGAFSSWDFDGDPATTDDAGWRECAAFAGFDTRFTFTTSGPSAPSVGPTTLLDVAGDVQNSPNENTTPLTPETFQIPAVLGVGAYFHPEGTDLLAELPRTVNVETAARIFFSRDAVAFAAGPSIRDFTVSNAAALGGIFDDNSAPLSFLRASVGFFGGGPIAEKDFPTPGDGTFGVPSEPSTPKYTWQDHDEIGTPGHPIALNAAGEPFTNRESEVSSLRELARTQFEAPANFIEQYFPRRLSADADALGRGERSGSLRHVRYDGPAQRPAILIQAGESRDNTTPDEGEPVAGEPPNAHPLSRQVTIPGYNHNDVIAAAHVQHDGRPEPSSAELAAFMLRVAGPASVRFARPLRRVRAGTTTPVRIVLRPVEGCRSGVLVRAVGRRTRTDARGRATLRVRATRPGVVRVVATKAGCRSARTTLTVLRRR